VASTTAGNIAGTLAAGLVLIPAIGSRWTAVAAALSSVAAACVVEWKARPGRAGLTRIAGAAATAGAVIALTPGWSTRLLTAAPFREGQTTQDSLRQYRERQRLHEVVFVREDAGGTVSVDRDGDNLTLRVNGKPDASLAMEDMLTQRLLGHYPMLFHQDPKQVMIVGIGSGVTAGAVLRHPVESVTVAEISEGVAEASRLFEAANHAYWRDPRLRLRLEDARNVLLIEPARYDVIISEPSNLWMAGVATLYTQEFYKLVSSRMRPHGIFLQWVHSYEMSEDDLKLVFRTLLSVFPHATAFRSSPGDLQILASVEPFSWDFPRIERALARPEVHADLAPFGLEDVLTLLAQEEIPEPEFVAYAGSGRVHVDDWPLLEKSTPKSLFNKTRVTLPEMEFRLTNPHALVRRYMAGREPTPDELYRLARAATLSGPSNNIVLGYLEAAIRAEPGYRPASWLLAEIHAHRGDYGRAVSVLERLTTVAPPVAEDYERLGTYALEEARRNVGFFSPFDPSASRRVQSSAFSIGVWSAAWRLSPTG
jgi:spermidine synthase